MASAWGGGEFRGACGAGGGGGEGGGSRAAVADEDGGAAYTSWLLGAGEVKWQESEIAPPNPQGGGGRAPRPGKQVCGVNTSAVRPQKHPYRTSSRVGTGTIVCLLSLTGSHAPSLVEK